MESKRKDIIPLIHRTMERLGPARLLSSSGHRRPTLTVVYYPNLKGRLGEPPRAPSLGSEGPDDDSDINDDSRQIEEEDDNYSDGEYNNLIEEGSTIWRNRSNYKKAEAARKAHLASLGKDAKKIVLPHKHLRFHCTDTRGGYSGGFIDHCPGHGADELVVCGSAALSHRAHTAIYMPCVDLNWSRCPGCNCSYCGTCAKCMGSPTHHRCFARNEKVRRGLLPSRAPKWLRGFAMLHLRMRRWLRAETEQDEHERAGGKALTAKQTTALAARATGQLGDFATLDTQVWLQVFERFWLRHRSNRYRERKEKEEEKEEKDAQKGKKALGKRKGAPV
jgi:hypothetical protein